MCQILKKISETNIEEFDYSRKYSKSIFRGLNINQNSNNMVLSHKKIEENDTTSDKFLDGKEHEYKIHKMD